MPPFKPLFPFSLLENNRLFYFSISPAVNCFALSIMLFGYHWLINARKNWVQLLVWKHGAPGKMKSFCIWCSWDILLSKWSYFCLRFNDAINLLRRLLSCFTCDSRRGYWTLRLSIDLEHMGCPSESLSVAEGGLLDSWVRAGSRVALQRRVLRLGKPPRRWKIPSFSESIKRKITEVIALIF